MNEPQTTTRAGPAPTPRTHYVALLTPLVLTQALQSADELLNRFRLSRMLGVDGIATAASVFPAFLLLLSLIIGLSACEIIGAGQA
jgi:Na+-driven multidrug efflux pump